MSESRRPPATRLCFIGLTITSSWGNGHATTYRALIKALARLGYQVTFLERDVPWYADNRDQRAPEGCHVKLYSSLNELFTRHEREVATADAVIVGSYVPDGCEVLDWALANNTSLRLFYDIDTPVTLAALAANKPTYIAPRQIAELDGYLSFTGGPTLTRLERDYAARRALPLFCSVDPELYRPLAVAPTRDLGYLGTYSDDRQATLERLLIRPARESLNLRFVVAGPSYPPIDWPANVERVDHVAPGDHAAFYNSLRYALNVTRADMIDCGYSPSVRLFEAAACGVPIISDVWNGIEHYFEPGREILLANHAEDVLARLNATSDAERKAIGQAALRRVLAEHTAHHRALQLARYLQELRAARSSGGRRSHERESRTRNERRGIVESS